MRGRKLCEAADSPPAEAEEDEEDKKDEEDGEERESKEEEKQKEEAEEEGRVDTDDCEVCPGTEASRFSWGALTAGGEMYLCFLNGPRLYHKLSFLNRVV